MSVAAVTQLAQGAAWPSGCAWAVRAIASPAPTLFATEEAAMTRASTARKLEFACGRGAAREAMNALGRSPTAIPMSPDRSPDWPSGVTGSISHANGICIAATTQGRGTLGIDLEQDAPLPAEVIETVCHPTELDEFGPAPRSVFSAKEAIYKAVFPLCHIIFDFQTLRLSQGVAEFTQSVGPIEKGMRLPWAQSRGEGWILSICALGAPI